MSNILVRTLSGAVFIALIIGSIYFGTYSTIICLGLFMLLGLHEFYHLFKTSEIISVQAISNTITGTIIYTLIALYFIDIIPDFKIIILILFPLLFINLLIEIWRKKTQPILNLGIQFLGYFYVVVPFLIMIFISKEFNYLWLIFMFILIWTNDTFAYLSGRFFGKTQLFERISPKKTWEGTIGGILMTVLMSMAIAFFTQESYFFWTGAALIIAPSAIFGDLLESLFKRSLNIKDSGNIMPGHGGILDRFDAALLTAPFFLCWVLIYNYF